jgi:GrpB-like predicted nucleotidyltransferase (UPF0157 family)
VLRFRVNIAVHRVFDGDQRPGFSLADRPAGWDETVTISAYQPSWPIRYAIELRVLREALSDLQPQIEHVGSTAVATMAARPIVDIALGLRRPSQIAAFRERLRNFGYLTAEPGPAACERLFVRRERGVRTHHLLLVEAGGRQWHALLAFRDTLLADAALAARYRQLKGRFNRTDPATVQAYREAKTEFIRRALAAADPPAGV